MRLSFLLFLDRWGNRPFKACEIGVYDGKNSIAMLEYTPLLTKMYLVDNFQPNSKHFSRPNCKPFTPSKVADFVRSLEWKLNRYKDRAELVRKPSVEAAKDFPDGFFDYVYIDAEHTTEAVKADITSWYPKVKKFGMLAGHDAIHTEVTLGVLQSSHKMNVNNFYVNAEPLGFWDADMADYLDWWIFKLK